MLADFLASSWPLILIFVTVGYVLGRVRPFAARRRFNSQLQASADQLGRRGGIQPSKPWPRHD